MTQLFFCSSICHFFDRNEEYINPASYTLPLIWRWPTIKTYCFCVLTYMYIPCMLINLAGNVTEICNHNNQFCVIRRMAYPSCMLKINICLLTQISQMPKWLWCCILLVWCLALISSYMYFWNKILQKVFKLACRQNNRAC